MFLFNIKCDILAFSLLHEEYILLAFFALIFFSCIAQADNGLVGVTCLGLMFFCTIHPHEFRRFSQFFSKRFFFA